MAALVAAIHVLLAGRQTWMPGSSPGMTRECLGQPFRRTRYALPLPHSLECGRRFNVHGAEIMHGLAGALHQPGGSGAQRRKRGCIERAEEQVIDRAELGGHAVDLEAAGRRETQQHAAAVLW